MDELLARFLPQFLTLARSRVAVAITRAAQRDQAEMAKTMRELHTLAGEAGLLGLSDVVPLARDCEKKAAVLQGSRAEADAETTIAALQQLERAIEAIAATMLPAAGQS